MESEHIKKQTAIKQKKEANDKTVKMSPQQEQGNGDEFRAVTETEYGSNSPIMPLQNQIGGTAKARMQEMAMDQQISRQQQYPVLSHPVANKNGGTNTNINVPSFLVKTYDIVCDPQSDDIIAWNEEGNAFIVKQVNKFSDQVLPKYFKHNNFASFIRQLNMYDFHKTRNGSNQQCFQHSLFQRGKEELLQDIKRKNSTAAVEKQQRQMIQQMQLSQLVQQQQLNLQTQSLQKNICQQENGFVKKRDFKDRGKAVLEMNAGQSYYMPQATQAGQSMNPEIQKMNQQQMVPLPNAGAQNQTGTMVGQQTQSNGQSQPYSIYAPRPADLSSQQQMHQQIINTNQKQILYDDHRVDAQQPDGNYEAQSHFTQLLNNIQSRLEKIEDRFQKVEMLNQSYMQRNFELAQENQELLKAKDSQKILEKIFLMFINSFGSGGIANHEGIMSIFPQFMRQRELLAPPMAASEGDRFENQSQVEIDMYEATKTNRNPKYMKGSMIDQLSSSAEKQQDNTIGLEELSSKLQHSFNNTQTQQIPGSQKADQAKLQEEYIKKLNIKNQDGQPDLAKNADQKHNLYQGRGQDAEKQADHNEQLVIRPTGGPMTSQPPQGGPNAHIGRNQYAQESELHGNKNEMKGLQHGSRQRERGSPSSLIDEEIDGKGRQDQRDQLKHLQEFDNYIQNNRKYGRKRTKPGKQQSSGSFNFQNFMKEMLFEFFNQKQEQLNSPKRFSPRGVEYNLQNLGGIGNLGLRDQTRFSADYNQMNNYKANISSNQFKHWFQEQIAAYMSQNKNKQYLTYKEDANDESHRFQQFKHPGSKHERSRGDYINQQLFQDHQDASKGAGNMNHANFFENAFPNTQACQNASEKNEFSSVTDLLNQQDQHIKGQRSTDFQNEEGEQHSYVHLQKSQPSHSPNAVLHRQRPREREAPMTNRKQEPLVLFDKNKQNQYLREPMVDEELSSIAPSPKLQANQHMDLATDLHMKTSQMPAAYNKYSELEKQAIAYQKQHQQQQQKRYSQELAQNLREHLGDGRDSEYFQHQNARADSILYEEHPRAEKPNKNEQSNASSLPDFLDPSQLLRKMSGNYPVNMIDTSPAIPMHSRKAREQDFATRSFMQHEESSAVLPMSQKRYQNEQTPQARDLENSPREQRNQQRGHSQQRPDFRDPRSMTSEPTENSELQRQKAQQKFIAEFDRDSIKSFRQQQNPKNDLLRFQHQFSKYYGENHNQPFPRLINCSSRSNTNNHNVEFETISSHSNTASRPLLGKRPYAQPQVTSLTSAPRYPSAKGSQLQDASHLHIQSSLDPYNKIDSRLQQQPSIDPTTQFPQNGNDPK